LQRQPREALEARARVMGQGIVLTAGVMVVLPPTPPFLLPITHAPAPSLRPALSTLLHPWYRSCTATPASLPPASRACRCSRRKG
jgi:hypothetical protein